MFINFLYFILIFKFFIFHTISYQFLSTLDSQEREIRSLNNKLEQLNEKLDKLINSGQHLLKPSTTTTTMYNNNNERQTKYNNNNNYSDEEVNNFNFF